MAEGEKTRVSEPAMASSSVLQAPEVSRVAIRIPPFWPADPEVWFWQVEKQLELGGIVRDDTKFNYVVGNLDPMYMAEVRDIIQRPPENGKYQKLKTELIRRLGSPQEQKTRRLLEHEEIGDRKPSQFLRHLQALAGSAVPEDLVRSLWLGRLPPSIQAILATQSKADTATVAELADAVFEALPRQQVMAVAPVKTSMESTLEKLTETMVSLTSRIASMQCEIAEIRRRDRSQSRSRSASRESVRSTGSNNRGLCWYHFRFGDNARKCRSPCSKRTENPNGSR